MKIKVMSKKKWKAHKIELARAYQAGFVADNAKIQAAIRDVDVLSAALWLALQKEKEVLSMESSPIVVIANSSPGKIAYRIKEAESLIHVELYHKALLPS